MGMTQCKECKEPVWRAMDGDREALFERAAEVFCFRGLTRGGLAVAQRVPAMYRIHRCRNARRRERKKNARWSGRLP